LMDPYMYKRNNEGIHIINVAKTWEKLMVAARIIAAVTNPRDILVMSLIPTDFRLSPTESTPREPF
jgi:small subunit ribosomal protein SAe